MHKTFIFGFFFIILLFIVSYQVYSHNQVTPNNNNVVIDKELPPCEDTHLDEKNNKDIEIVKKVNPESDRIDNFSKKSALKNVIATYFKVENLSDIIISQQSETHAQGEFGQKWWLAFNDKKDGWQIVATGCSYIDCDEISGYNFPSEMAPVCWDSKNNQLVTR